MKSDPVDVLERCVGGRVKTHYIGFSQDFDDWRDPSTSGHLSVAAVEPHHVYCASFGEYCKPWLDIKL